MAFAGSRRTLLSTSPGLVFPFPGASLDFNFAVGLYWGGSVASLSVSRASIGTNLLPTSLSGFAYATFGNNLARITFGSGLLVEESRTNQLLHSAAPSTQTTGSLATGTYILWANGSGSATSSAGTATGTGFGTATNGSPNTFMLTGAGTVTVTVSGSLNTFQLELGSFGTSFIPTTSATVTRSADIVTVSNPPTFGNAFTLFASGTPMAPTSYGTLQNLLNINGGSTSNYIAMYRSNTTGNPSIRVNAGGSTLENLSIVGAGAWTQNSLSKVAFSGIAGAQQASFNGTRDTSALSAASVPTVSAINIGSQPSTDCWDGYVARVALWATVAQPVNFLQQITLTQP